jgi:hypothetical protein
MCAAVFRGYDKTRGTGARAAPIRVIGVLVVAMQVIVVARHVGRVNGHILVPRLFQIVDGGDTQRR